MTPVGLPVVVRVKRKRDLDPVDTIVVEADETPAAKRRARDAALAAELDAVLEGGLAGGPDGSKDAGARGRDAADGAEGATLMPSDWSSMSLERESRAMSRR